MHGLTISFTVMIRQFCYQKKIYKQYLIAEYALKILRIRFWNIESGDQQYRSGLRDDIFKSHCNADPPLLSTIIPIIMPFSGFQKCNNFVT